MSWMDTQEERSELHWVINNVIPNTSGMWGQPMFTLKYTSCEDPTREECSCVMYNDKHKDERDFEGLTFSAGVVWSKVMAQTDEDLMTDDLVDANM